MLLRIGYEIRFSIPEPTPIHCLLHSYPNRYPTPEPERITIEPATPFEIFDDHFGNRCTRLVAQPGPLALLGDGVVEVTRDYDHIDFSAVQHPVQDLPIATLPYLLSSRYCEVDRLTEFAWKMFGNGPTGYLRVQAVCDFVHKHLKFGYNFARNTKGAYEALVEQRGVCRDFAHLTIALCRCLGFPARYATGYLPDIGVPISDAPNDFSAWCEVFLSNQWFTFDARHNQPRIGRVLMAIGRDAADCALTTSFGPTLLDKFVVHTTEITG